MDLDKIPLWRGDDVAVREVWSFYTQYLYLPRLRDVNVLLAAVADGVGLITWRQDGFAYFDARDEAQERYVGRRAAEGVTLADATGLLVKPAAAAKQLEAKRQGTGTGTGSPADRPGDSEGDDYVPEDGESRRTVPRRFHGSVSVDPTRLALQAGEIAEAVVAHLDGLLDASVEVTLEIHADIPGGTPDQVVRTVTENAATLRFDPGAGFEAE